MICDNARPCNAEPPLLPSPSPNALGRAWRLSAILVLGFASGLPLALTGQAMQAWLTVEPTNSFLLMVVLIWIQTGFAMVILSAALRGIPEETIEAAILDGASPLQIFARIKVPQIWGTIAVVFTAATGGVKSATLSIAQPLNDAVSYINQRFFDPLDSLRTFALLKLMNPFRDALQMLPWPLAISAVAVLAGWLGGRGAAFSVFAMGLFVVVTGYWSATMGSLYLTILAVLLSLALGFPFGIWVAAKPRMQQGVQLLLDTLQTLPTLRIETRFPDPIANPYLCFSALMMAGLDGIQNKIHPGDPADKNLYDLPPEEDAKIPTVCASLDEALEALKADHEFLTRGGVFSKEMIDAYIELKMEEVQRMRMTPHPIEYDMYYGL